MYLHVDMYMNIEYIYVSIYIGTYTYSYVHTYTYILQTLVFKNNKFMLHTYEQLKMYTPWF